MLIEIEQQISSLQLILIEFSGAPGRLAP